MKIFRTEYTTMGGEFHAIVVAEDAAKAVEVFTNYFEDEINSPTAAVKEVGIYTGTEKNGFVLLAKEN
jgi:hypothetical protein